MRNYGCIFSVLIAAFGVSACNSGSHGDFRQCQFVKPGMTENEVIARMGAAQDRELKDNGLWLYYREEPGSSGPIVVVLSEQRGTYRVEQAACNGLG